MLNNHNVRLLGRAISLSLSALRHDQRQLSEQLASRFASSAVSAEGYKNEVQDDSSESIKSLEEFKWWCPTLATWEQGDEPCVKLLERHKMKALFIYWSRGDHARLEFGVQRPAIVNSFSNTLQTD
jgi:hypothetical protein